MMTFDTHQLTWTRPPKDWKISKDSIEITTQPYTDLWQRTYYGFQNDNAPVLQMETDQLQFSFVVKTSFDSKVRFDQCGIVLYLNSENWLKASIEYENQDFQHLGSVVTNHGYSDWATTEIPLETQSMWYRLSRRGADYRIESSLDGITYKQMRICHLHEGGGPIRFGLYACAVLKTHHLKLGLAICLLALVFGKPMTVKHQITPFRFKDGPFAIFKPRGGSR